MTDLLSDFPSQETHPKITSRIWSYINMNFWLQLYETPPIDLNLTIWLSGFPKIPTKSNQGAADATDSLGTPISLHPRHIIVERWWYGNSSNRHDFRGFLSQSCLPQPGVGHALQARWGLSFTTSLYVCFLFPFFPAIFLWVLYCCRTRYISIYYHA